MRSSRDTERPQRHAQEELLSEYPSRIIPQKVSQLLAAWHDALAGEAILKGESINLDFHSVPYFGEHPLVESHYQSEVVVTQSQIRIVQRGSRRTEPPVVL